MWDLLSFLLPPFLLLLSFRPLSSFLSSLFSSSCPPCVHLFPEFCEAAHYRVCIIGAGASGLTMGKRLHDVNICDYVILEKSHELGGTWNENRYPGAACDVPSHYYSFSFFLNPFWPYLYSGWKDILKYMNEMAVHFGVMSHIIFQTEVVGAEWDEGRKRWIVSVVNKEKKRSFEISADFLISGVGVLHQPAYPNIPNLHSFQGLLVHTAHWTEEASKAIKGKRVAVIGTGATAVQLVPAIADDVSHLYVFQRTASWCPKRNNRSHSSFLQRIFARFPFLMRLYRWVWFWYLEFLFVTLFCKEDTFFRRIMKKFVEGEMREAVEDPVLRERLTPKYDVFLKRITPSDHYLQAFNKKHVTLVTDHIKEFTKNGIKTQQNAESEEIHYDLDVIILATGFSPKESVTHLPYKGKGGKTLNDVWGEDSGVGYYGISLSSHPNFFFLLGPGTVLGHSSVLFMIECQVDYVISAILSLQKSNHKVMTVKEKKEREYREWAETKMKDLVWSKTEQGQSWYHNSKGVCWVLWPSTLVSYWWNVRSCDMSDYDLE